MRQCGIQIAWLLVVVCAAVTSALSRSCRQSKQMIVDPSGATPGRWQLHFLVRKVDESNAYYRRLKFEYTTADSTTATTGDGDSLLNKLLASLTAQLNVTGIQYVVKNDLAVLTTSIDVLDLECGDRLEVVYRGCGAPTRAQTLTASSEGLSAVYSTSRLAQCQVGCTNSYLLFTIRSGIGVKAWTAYNAASGSASILPKMVDDAEQPNLFRSDALDNLESLAARLQLRELLLVVYNSHGAPVLQLTFDMTARPLTRLNWFNQSRLTGSWPIANVREKTFNFFSIEGHDFTDAAGATFERRFFANYNYGGCGKDAGVLLVMDVVDGCEYARPGFSASPMIAYAASVDGSWSRGLQRGHRLSVFVR